MKNVAATEYSQPVPMATATSTIMSSVLARSADDRAGEEDRRRVEDDGQAQQQQPDVAVDAERRRELACPAASVPTIDQATIGTVNTSATRKRLRMSRAIASIDMPAWPPWPWPWASSARCDRGVVVRSVVGLDERVADVAGRRLAGAVVAAVLDPAAQLLDRRRGRVERDRGGLRDGIGLDGEHARPVAEHLLDDRLLGRVVQAADVQDDRVGSR